MAVRFPTFLQPEDTARATRGTVGAEVTKEDAAKIAGGDDWGGFGDFGFGDFGFDDFGGDPFGGGVSDPFGLGASDPFGAGNDPLVTGGDLGASDPFHVDDPPFDPFHAGDPSPLDTGTGADVFGTSTGGTYDPTQFVGPLPADDQGTATFVGPDADGAHLPTETPTVDHDGDAFVGPLPPDVHADDDHAPVDLHADDVHTDDVHAGDDHVGDDHVAADVQGAHDFDVDPDHHSGVSDVATDDAGHLVTHFADGSSVTTDGDGNVLSFTEPPHDGATTTSAPADAGHTSASADPQPPEGTHATEDAHAGDGTPATDGIHDTDETHGIDASHVDGYGPDFVGPIPADGHHDDIPVAPPLVLAHGDGDDHVDVASHVTEDTSGHAQDDVVHVTGAAHEGIVSTELDHESGNTVTHFADGTSLTTDHDGNVVAFSEHPGSIDPAHPDTATGDGHVTTGDHPSGDDHAGTAGEHGPTVGATGPGGASTVTDATLLQNPNLGSCYVDASLIGAGNYVNGLVKDNGDGTYTVTLASRTGTTYDVTVTPPTTNYGASPNGTDAETARNMQIVEQAVAVARDDGSTHAPGEIADYNSIANGGVVSGVLAQIGLTDVHSTWKSDSTITGYTVTSAFEAGNVVVVSTTKDTSNPSLEAWGITPGHALAVTGVTQDPATGLTLVTFTDSNGGTQVVVPAAVLGNGVLVDVSWGRPPGAPPPPNDFGPGDRPSTQSNPGNITFNPGDEYGPGDRPGGDDTSSEGADTSYTYTYGEGATGDEGYGDFAGEGSGGGYFG